jgi:hypothetical protein
MDDQVDNDRTRLRVKLGAAEIEYEGGTQFLKDEIMPTVGKIIDMVESRADLQRTAPPLQIERTAEPVSALPAGNSLDHSTNTIATLLGAKTANDLAFAAAGHLALVQKRERMMRGEILAEMKGATSFYKSTYRGNLSAALKALVKADLFRLVADDTYALSNKARKELEAALAKAE